MIEMENLSGKNVEIETGAKSLEAKIFLPKGLEPFSGVIFHHGRGTNMDGILPIGEELASQGIAALGFNFSNDELYDRVLDSEHSYVWFSNQPELIWQEIGISGSSMGAHTAVALAHKYPIESLVLRAPAAYLDGEFNATKSSETIKMIRKFEGALLIIQSEKDEHIPEELIDLFMNNAQKARKKEKYVMKGAGHALGPPGSPPREELKNVIVDWFKETLRPTALRASGPKGGA